VLSVPLMVTVMIALVFLVIWISTDTTPIGYIDQSGMLANPVPPPPVKWPERTVPLLAYFDEASARADLQAGELQLYYIIPEDYLQTGQVEQVYEQEPGEINTEQFYTFLTVNLLAGEPKEVANRILDGAISLFELLGKLRIQLSKVSQPDPSIHSGHPILSSL
jgi:hypothetical protein